MNRYHIGIDTGRHTGVAVWDTETRRLVAMETVTITKAMEIVLAYRNIGSVMLRIEDARQRKWYGNTGRERLKGAGSVCRDATVWEDWCKEKGISCEFVAPRCNKTKMDKAQFKFTTKWIGKTSEHSRDAAMLVFGR